MEETLNIEAHIKPMLIKALNKYLIVELAAKALGIGIRTLQRYKHLYGIGRKKDGLYYLKPQKNIILQSQVN